MSCISTSAQMASLDAKVPVRPTSVDNSVCSPRRVQNAGGGRPAAESQRILAALMAKPTRRASHSALRPPRTVSSPAFPARTSPPPVPHPIKWAQFNGVVRDKLNLFLRSLGLELLGYSGIARPDKVAELLLRGAPIDSVDGLGRTALHLACLVEIESSADEPFDEAPFVLSTIKLLLEQGANVHLRDDRLDTPLHLAATKPYQAVLGELIEAGSNVNSRNELGMTPLHLSILSDLADNCEQLLLAGAEINAQDAEGRTALHLAVVFCDIDMLAILLNHPHIDLSVRAPSSICRRGEKVAWLTAREEAQAAGFLPAVKLLQDAELCLAALSLKADDKQTNA